MGGVPKREGDRSGLIRSMNHAEIGRPIRRIKCGE